MSPDTVIKHGSHVIQIPSTALGSCLFLEEQQHPMTLDEASLGYSISQLFNVVWVFRRWQIASSVFDMRARLPRGDAVGGELEPLVIPRDREDLESYFREFHMIKEALRVAVSEVKERWPDARLEIRMNRNPEFDDEFPVLVVKIKNFSLDFLLQLDKISEEVVRRLGPDDGWLLIIGGPDHAIRLA